MKKQANVTSSGLPQAKNSQSPIKEQVKKQPTPVRTVEPFDDEKEGFGDAADEAVNKFHNRQMRLNPELDSKTNALQDEFEILMEEMQRNRVKRDAENLYTVIDEFHGKGPNDQKHSSPTKRLISLKNTTSEHKKEMSKFQTTQDYKLTYCSSPGKSYVIEPHGGELNYNLAQKNPLKFYEQVFTQEITQHKVKEGGNHDNIALVRKNTKKELSSKVTHRPFLKIMEKIRLRISEKLRAKIGETFGEDIFKALKDKQIED